MGHERGNCTSTCKRDKRNCFHNVAFTIVRQFATGKWLIENPYHYVTAILPENMVFEEGEYNHYRNPSAPTITIEEEDFNAKLLRLKKTMTASAENSVHLNVNGSATDVDHWDDSEKAWHTKDCKVVLR